MIRGVPVHAGNDSAFRFSAAICNRILEIRPVPSTTERRLPAVAKPVIGLIVLAALVSSPFWLRETDLLRYFSDTERLRDWVAGLGVTGPFAVIALMTVAILVSPIPSAPIALAAGAAYGHTWGTLYVLLGSELGAVAAFSLARLLGHDFLRRRFGDKLSVGLEGSQNLLMGTVFVTRLLPFLSFDLISYAAGLTNLTFLRFAIATLAGIVPASFLLAHLGSEMVTEETDRILISALLLGLLTLIPIAAKFLIGPRQR